MSGPFFTGDWDPTMRKALEMNVPGQRKSPTPILVIQGTKDDVVLPEWTRQLQSRALKSGDLIKGLVVRGGNASVGHRQGQTGHPALDRRPICGQASAHGHPAPVD